MSTSARKIALFGILTALMLVLGLIDAQISTVFGAAIPGIRLGLANTVLLFAIYMIDWRGAVLMMLVKILTLGLLSGNTTGMLCTMLGTLFSFTVMMLVRRRAWTGAAAGMAVTAAMEIWLLRAAPRVEGETLWHAILIGLAFIGCSVLLILMLKGVIRSIPGASIAGGICHNIGQVTAAILLSWTMRLADTWMPVLIGVGAVVGCLTGLIAERVIAIYGHHAHIPYKEGDQG